MNLNAVWKENSYSIGIDVNGGYGNDTIIVTGYEQDNHLPNELLRPGYNLDSWNSDRDGDGTRYERVLLFQSWWMTMEVYIIYMHSGRRKREYV